MWQAAAAAAAAQQRLWVELRQQRLLRKEKSESQQLAAADQALQEGDMEVACLIFVRLALARPTSAITLEAKQRLARLQQQAREELRAIDERLGDKTGSGALDPAQSPALSDSEFAQQVSTAFQAYDSLSHKYGDIPVVGSEISRHITRQTRRPEYVAVLNEAKAKSLWELGQRYEKEGHACCAYLVFEQATEFVPAPSAQLAQKRLTEMKKVPAIVASVRTCRELQWCHETYLSAERLVATRPGPARGMFEQIVSRAPKDSDVFQAALKQIELLQPSNADD